MIKNHNISLLMLFAVLSLLINGCGGKTESDRKLRISNPFEDALFPPEFPAPAFDWWSPKSDREINYDVRLYTDNKKLSVTKTVSTPNWTPDEADWEKIKTASEGGDIIFAVKRSGTDEKESTTRFSISKDSVGAPVLYRQMPIPFLFAEKNLDSMNFVLIDFGSKSKPHVAMKGFPVCGNCHSLSMDGGTLGLDLDAGLRDKGGYFITKIRDTVMFNIDNYNSWSRLEKRRTFGLFSKISPDGKYLVTTVKDRVVIKNFPIGGTMEELKYSQLFFPVNGHLAIYNIETKELHELPGANLEEYVQSNAIWTPDGKNIIFCRAEALPREGKMHEIDVKDTALVNSYVRRDKKVKYDICIIPFNDGKGGEARLIKGASANGKSNYFPAASPDGKWLTFCQSESFMLLQPDSRLYIVPLEGGKSRMLKSNFRSMNSWHAWSPNSRWMVFVSKIYGPFTDLFLTHIDEKGNSSVPVLVEKARVPYTVVNYPEFVNSKPDRKFVMQYDFVEIAHIFKATKEGNYEEAKKLYYKYAKQDPFLFKQDCKDLSILLRTMGLPEEAKKYDELAKVTIDTEVFKEHPGN
jgi:hypothetical protein